MNAGLGSDSKANPNHVKRGVKRVAGESPSGFHPSNNDLCRFQGGLGPDIQKTGKGSFLAIAEGG